MRIGRAAKHVGFALLPLVLLLALAELTLWALDLGAPDRQLALSRGFDRTAAYLVPDPERPGGWRSQMFEVESLEVKVPPRSERRRLVLLGGSNTQGFPSAELARRLDEADPDPGWEVVNLGRAGYGSERVSILMEQCLQLEPDVVLIYCGHNEFMESGFALELGARGAFSMAGRAVEGLSNLRTMNVLVEALQPELKDRSFDRKPEPRSEDRGEAFRRMKYADTLLCYEAYRVNLERMLDVARQAGVAVVLTTVVGNDLVPPYVTNYSSATTQGQADEHRRLVRQARGRIPERFRRHLLPPQILTQPDWGISLRPEEQERRREQPPAGGRAVPPLRTLLGEFAAAPATQGPKMASVAGAHWPDPALWVTPVYDVLDTLSAVHARDLDDTERAGLVQAVRHLERARELVPDAPQGLFDLALVSDLLGDDAGALALFRESARYDRAPRRGNDVSNGIVRELAASRGVAFVDVEQRFRERCPGGLVGYEVMTDVCHLQPGVRPVLMADLVPGVLEAAP